MRITGYCPDPDTLTDDEWAMKVNEMWWALEFTGRITRKDGKTQWHY